jgi:hypothetical protein
MRIPRSAWSYPPGADSVDSSSFGREFSALWCFLRAILQWCALGGRRSLARRVGPLVKRRAGPCTGRAAGRSLMARCRTFVGRFPWEVAALWMIAPKENRLSQGTRPMSSVQIVCPSCGRRRPVPVKYIGRSVKCTCGVRFVASGEAAAGAPASSEGNRAPPVADGSMRIRFPCPECGLWLSMPDQYAGRTAKCPQCGALARVPCPQPAAKLPPQARLDNPTGGRQRATPFVPITSRQPPQSSEPPLETLPTIPAPPPLHAVPVPVRRRRRPEPPPAISQQTWINIEQRRPFPHFLHLVFTVLTCGFWFPVWVLHYIFSR